jgi:uncharacterized membrane protein
MRNSELKSLARNQLKGRWWEAISFHLVYFAIIFIPSFIVAYNSDPYYYSTGESVFDIITFILTAPFALGFCYFSLNFIKHENKMSDILFGFKKFGKVFIAYLLTTLAIIIGLIFLIVPGIILGLMFSQIYYIIAEDDDISAIEAIKESARIMKGNKLRYFILGLSFIGWSIVGIITLGIGFIWIVPYYNITLANFYKDISKDITWSEQ